MTAQRNMTIQRRATYELDFDVSLDLTGWAVRQELRDAAGNLLFALGTADASLALTVSAGPTTRIYGTRPPATTAGVPASVTHGRHDVVARSPTGYTIVLAEGQVFVTSTTTEGTP